MDNNENFDKLVEEANEVSPEILKRVYRYSHDMFFKYLNENDEYIRNMLCQVMMPEVKIVKTKIINNNTLAQYYKGKNMILDVLAEDDQGNKYNLEMQCYTVTDNEFKRFLSYECKVLSSQVKRGEDYHNVRPVRQLIINAGSNVKELDHYIHVFEYYDKIYHKEYPGSLMKTMFINLGHMDEAKDMDEFNQLMYLFKYDKLCDKIESSKEIKKVTEMHEKYTEEEMLQSAIKREIEEWYYYANIADSKQKGIEEGIEKGKNQERLHMLSSYLLKKYGDDKVLEGIETITEEQALAIMMASSLEEVKEILK